ncbi:MAG: T9SS type A sorting domain-containing protein [Chitinophagales bacterium]|nr:T9SS type A sorting domain-containing protein [Chitinophagales bacterium]
MGLYSTKKAGSSVVNGNATVYARPNHYDDFIEPPNKSIIRYNDGVQYTSTVINNNGCFTNQSATVKRSDFSVNSSEELTNSSIKVKYPTDDATFFGDDVTTSIFDQDNVDLKATKPNMSGTVSYTWYNVSLPDKPALTSTSQELIIEPPGSGYDGTSEYPSDTSIFMVQFSNGSVTSQSSITVNVTPGIQISQPARTIICNDEIELQLSATGADEKNGDVTAHGIYTWYTNQFNGNSFATNNKITVTPPNNSSTIYIVQGVTASDAPFPNLANLASIQITTDGNDPSYTVDRSPTGTIYAGECLELSIDDPQSQNYYTWEPEQELQSITGNSVNTISLSAGMHPFTVNGIDTKPNDYGCCGQQTKTYTVSSTKWCADCKEFKMCKPYSTFNGFSQPLSLNSAYTELQSRGYEFQWIKSGTPMLGETNPSYTIQYPTGEHPSTNDTFYCKIYNSDLNCSFFTDPFYFTKLDITCEENKQLTELNASENLDKNQYEVTISPNPSSELFKLEIYDLMNSGSPKDIEIKVIDNFNRVFSDIVATLNNELKAEINLSSLLPDGIYYAVVKINNQIIVKPIFKIH